jgi:CIC family chloride channel protein
MAIRSSDPKQDGGILMNPSDQQRQRARFFSSFFSPDQVRRWLRVSVRSTWRSNRLLFYAALVGVFGGLGAQLFVWMLDWGERIFSVGLAGYTHPASGVLHPAPHFGPWGVWLIPLATTLGGLLCGLLVYSLAPEAEGHGTDAAVAAYHFHGGKVRPIVPAVKAAASAITIGSGGAAGREGPTAQISVGAASILCDLLNLQEAERRMLVLAGMAAGLSAIFRSPLGMAIFAVEIMYASMASEYEALPFTLVAAVVAYAVNGFFVGWSPIFLLPSNLEFTRPVELLGYAFLGVVAGIIGAVEPSIFYRMRDRFRRLQVPNHIKPALGGLLMGLLAMAFPQSASTGYGWVQMTMTSGYVGHILIVLVFVKILAMSLTISSGGSGGVFGPNVYIGAMLGGWVAFVMDKWIPAAHFTPAAFAVVGMGAVFAGTARVPLATLIMVAEMTGGYGLIVPAMLASALSFTVQRSLSARARYPRLYEAQVEGRLDSPVHHLRLVQGAFRILETAAVHDLRGVSLPDLNNLLRLGQSISIHGGKGHIFAFTVASPDHPLVGRPAAEVNGTNGGLVLIVVVRGEEVLPPGHGGTIEQGDTLIIAAGDDAYRDFLQKFGQTDPAAS